VYPKSNSFITALGRDSKTQDGFDPSWGIIDEFHEAKDNQLLEVIESGMGARQDPMIDIITTAGFNKSGACYAFRKVCIEVLEGKKKDDRLFALIFSHENEKDWQDEKNWQISNPNLDVSVHREYLKARVNAANNEGGTTEVGVKTKNFNIWTNASDTWIQDGTWMQNRQGLKVEDLLGQKCYIGIDLAKKLDINAVVLFFPEVKEINGKLIHAILPHFFIPTEKKEKDADHVDLLRWIRAGYVQEIGDFSIDFRDLTPILQDIFAKYDVKTIGFDRRYAYDGTIKGLMEAGYDCAEVVQTTNYLNLPTTELEKMAVSGVLEHFGNPVLRWMVGNVELYTDTGGSVKPDKKKSTNKIDGVAALINAIFVWMAEKDDQIEPSIEFW
jgi:phage terminase large subunit-like protein